MEISCPRMTVFKISRDDLIEALGRYIKVNAQIQTREHTLADLVFTYLTSLQFWLNKICKHVDFIFCYDFVRRIFTSFFKKRTYI
ncbi:hypothetical protein PCS_03609 [Desulfocurvibacter africanus PCS]|uniref:Uncharacterized protein n=1 Tax=Desulfocurvibacter africanus PCS TaxID=1262666 RepID=M5PNF5_DESAF|nr:hypothetical protein PCS_03609 [Desulfocurvibacter africanus PCS]